MATVSIDQIKELRERTSAGVMDCKRALEQADGDMSKAEKLLMRAGHGLRGQEGATVRPRRAWSRATSTPAAASA